jgi:uncharacterized membrane protein
MKPTTTFILLIIILSFAIATYSYQNFPEERIASHWNSYGQPDGYMSKFWGAFLFPIITLAVLLLFLIIPKIDPLKENIKKFRKHYDVFILVLTIFLFYIYILSILANFGKAFNMTTMIMPAIGLLFIYIGSLLKKLKQNWFIGIRTPWTLSNKTVWDKTHKLGSTLFKILGAILILATFAPPKYLIWIILVPIFGAVLWLFVYSYLEFKKMGS